MKVKLTRMAVVKRLPCLACQKQRCEQPFVTEVHHLVDKGYREHSGGDEATIPLCVWHHRGIQLEGHTEAGMRDRFGPSLFHTKRQFVAQYGSERDLLAETDQHLEAQV